MSINSDLLMVPRFVTAKSRDELVAVMLANNIKLGRAFKYQDISWDGKQWSAWFLADATDLIREQVNGITGDNRGS